MSAVQPAMTWMTADLPAPEPGQETACDPHVETLARRARDGDTAAFGELIDRYERAALATAYGVLRDPAGAADAVQEACLKAWHKRQSLQDPGRFGSWLLHIVRRSAIDTGRRRRPVEPLNEGRRDAALSADLQETDALAPLLRRETDEQVRRALAELDEETRLAVALRYYDGQSSRKIADVLDCSPAAVDMRLKRARDRLRQRLRPLMND